MSINEIQFKPGVHIRHDDPKGFLPKRIRHSQYRREFLLRKLESFPADAAISIEGDSIEYPLCTVGELLSVLRLPEDPA